MTKVITYGTYDLLHYGHIRLLERAKALGDYLIVGVTADDFDRLRGKINVQQSLMERIEAVRATGIADEIIVEEYDGQKIDDIKRYDVDIFTVGSDWVGKFDYLREYCEVIYLERTEGISSSEIREKKRSIALGMMGDDAFLNKVASEAEFVNGIHLVGICTNRATAFSNRIRNLQVVTNNYDKLLEICDAVYIRSQPEQHYEQIRKAFEAGKHVMCESPVCLNVEQYDELVEMSKEKKLIFYEAIKTAYSTAYSRLLLLVKEGKIGEVVSVEAVCTSLIETVENRPDNAGYAWNGIYEWGPTALLPAFQILGNSYKNETLIVRYSDESQRYDTYVKADFVYDNAVASVQVGNGIKSEGNLVIAGTKGYAYVPAPWWKTDYFELRYENPVNNKRYFYQLDGEGIRYELVSFARSIAQGKNASEISREVTRTIIRVMQNINKKNNIIILKSGLSTEFQ